MGRLIAIEGLDGAGKNTLTKALTAALEAAGAAVTPMAFPRYGQDVHADLIKDALHGELGDLAGSVNGLAMLFALDRRAAAAQIRGALADADVVLVDRYVASNAAYGAARLRQSAGGEFVEWVRAIEIGRFDVPAPDAQVLLRVPAAVAASRAEHRERADTTRRRDSFESDDDLQARVAAVYDQLAELRWLSPWHIVDGTGPVDAAVLAGGLGFGGS